MDKDGTELWKKVLEAFFEENFSACYRYAYSLMKDGDEAKDLVQDSFTNLIKKVYNESNFECHNLKAYLVIIMRNTALTRLNKMQKRAGDIPVEDCWDLEDDGNRVEEQTLGLLERDELKAAVQQLTQQQKDYIRMKFFEEKTDEEISEVLGVKPASVRKIRERALAKLKEYMVKGGAVCEGTR